MSSLQIKVSDPPNLPFPWEDRGPCPIQCYLGPQRPCHPVALAGCMSVTDIQMDHTVGSSVTIGSIITFSNAA